MRIHSLIRSQVDDGMAALLVQSRQIWGKEFTQTLPEIVIRLMVGVGDLSRLARNGRPTDRSQTIGEAEMARNSGVTWPDELWDHELKKELGNILFSTIRWIDDLGFDVLDCLDLAIEAQAKFAQSGKPR